MTAISQSRVAAELRARGATVGIPLTVTAVTGSTNDDARAAAQAGAPHGATFVADSQESGRGRHGHHWHSPPGQNLYLSVLLRPTTDASALAPLTLAIGVGVAAVVDGCLTEPRARIKWPNDVYVDDRKIAGILLEATTQGNAPPVVVVGVGLNVLSRGFPPELAATSLALAGGHDLERDRIAAALIASIGERYDAFVQLGLAPVLGELRARDFLAGRAVRVDGCEGTARGIDELGRLRVDTSEGERAVTAGTVLF